MLEQVLKNTLLFVSEGLYQPNGTYLAICGLPLTFMIVMIWDKCSFQQLVSFDVMSHLNMIVKIP